MESNHGEQSFLLSPQLAVFVPTARGMPELQVLTAGM